MRRGWSFLLAVSLLAAAFLAPWPGVRPAAAMQADPVKALLANMTSAEKVGQLVIVGFYGSSAGDTTDIYRLITQYHVGGVVLAAANDNITDTVQAPMQVLTLTNELQAAAVVGANIPRLVQDPNGGEPGQPPYIPLVIAINHEGDGYPYTEIQSGVTELPSAMAIGATWDASQAADMGRIAGTELAAMGVNFLLGPSLDVLETPRPEGTDLGTRVFGGDPFWVGVMGAAYIRGVHFGSGGQVAVIAKHFPGHGGSDRRPEQELPTVRKSIEDLQNFDLVPFFAVTGAPPGGNATDGLLAAHIRFQGFQGNIRQVTPPVSFDAQAFGQLLALPAVASWRASGGLTVSDSLGVRAVKQFYDPTERDFNNRRIAGGAFNAGNDLLLLTEFGLNPRADQTNNIVDTLAYFRQQYDSDQNFAARVDAAVSRILALKLRLYGGSFDPAAATRPVDGLSVLGRDQEDVQVLARDAAALISPTPDELQARAPEPPSPSQRIVFITDVRQGQQCSTCLRYPLLDKHQLENEVLKLYGPNGTGQIRSSNLQSFSFEELAAYLNGPTQPAPGNETPTPEPPAVEAALSQSDWIVFGMLNAPPDVPSARVVSTFLAQRPDLVRNKKVVVFAFSAPYFLDTTDLSKLTAFYALYSHTAPFVTVAARLLFRDLMPHAAPPVTVPSVGYDLIAITKPDPSRPIELNWQKASSEQPGTPQPTTLRLGDTITLTTGIILDQNGHTVPDQTPVLFRVFYREEGLPELLTAPTLNGVASVALPLNRQGTLEITASSEPALLSSTLTIPVTREPFSVTPIVPPTLTPSATPRPTATPEPPTATPTATITPTQVPVEPPPDAVDLRGFFVMCLGLAAIVFSGYRLGTNHEAQQRQGVRVALAGAIGVLLAYNYVALGLAGSKASYDAVGALAAPLWGLLGGGIGLAAGWYWFVGRHRRA